MASTDRITLFSRPSRARIGLLLTAALLLPAATLAARGVGTCGAPASTSLVGNGSGGAFGTPQLEALGQPLADGSGAFAFRISGGAPNAPGLLLLSRNEQPSFSSTYQTTLYAGPTPVFVPFQFDAQGVAVVTPRPTAQPIEALCGRALIAQATVFDFTASGGAGWSNALRFTFGVAAP